MKKKRLVLRGVADRVGVTKVTVSRFLRNPEWVFVALRGKIVAALDELGCIPNRAPDILSNITGRAIDVLLPSLTDQVFAEILYGIKGITDAYDHQTMLAHYGHKPEMEQERLKSMLSWNIGGLIFTGRTHTPRTLKMIGVARVPVMELIDSKPPCLDIAVGFDNFEAARQMTTAVIARGHRHIACLGAHLDRHITIKQEGCEQAMLDMGLMPYNVTVEQSSSYSSGIELIRQARREYPQLDGVFYTDDDLAVGAAFECQRLGLKIPNDTATAGFHGCDIGRVVEPRLASVLTPRERMGSIGAKRPLARIRGKSATPKMLGLGFTLSPGGSI